MAVKLADVVMRRTGLGTLGHPGQEALLKTAQLMGEEFQWTKEQMQREVSEVDELYLFPAPSLTTKTSF
jgi:glycerol-3-phosphate dehydrogenase